MTTSRNCNVLNPLFLLVFLVSAQTGEADETSPFDMTMEELLKIKVTTSSRFEESIHDAHASISIITKEQIAQFGGNYLHEILERIVSVGSTYGVLTSINTRGATAWTSLGHNLGLINGRPFGAVGGIHNLYSSMPITAIERIEYIRGPGSVLYGTNAYHGVFNIITKKADSQGWEGEQKLSLGSFDTIQLDGSYQFKQDDFSVSLNVMLADSDGWNAQMFDPELDDFYGRKAFQKEQTIHLDASIGNFSISHYNSQQERFANFWDAPEENYLPWFKDHPVKVSNLSYEYEISKDWRLESHITHDSKIMEWNSNGVADSLVKLKWPQKSRLIEANLFGVLSEDAQLLLGITHERHTIKNATTVPDSTESYGRAYFQFKHQLSDTLSYIAGGQYIQSIDLVNEVEDISDFVPRLGLIYDINERWAYKLLYGQAYRQPTAGERTIASPGVQKGTPDLRSEVIATLESQLYFQDKNQLFTLTYYESKERDLIVLAPSDDPLFALENKNQGKLDSKGLELEYKYYPDENWMLEFSWSKQSNRNGEAVEGTTLMPDYAWKLGVGYNVAGWKLGLYNLYYDDFQDSILFDANREIINPLAKSFHWLTFKASTEFFYFDNGSRVELSVEIKNILDEEIYFPNDTTAFYPSNTLPGREGRSGLISLTYRL